jgi:hypothetical protein
MTEKAWFSKFGWAGNEPRISFSNLFYTFISDEEKDLSFMST